MIAPYCDDQDVGEAWVASQWGRRLAARHDVTLLGFYKRGRSPASAQLPEARVVEWPEPPAIGRAERLNSLLKPGYISFYRHARRWTRRALAAGERFDLAYQPVPVAMRYPSPVTGLGIPYIIGPVGGSLPSPPGFADVAESAPWYVGLRGLDQIRIRRDPLLRRTYEEASCVLGIADYVRDFLSDLTLQRLEIMSETGLEALPGVVDRRGRSGGVRLLFVGRLVRTKGAQDAIRALRLVSNPSVTLDIVGDGFDREACERLTAELGLTQQVRFQGWLSRPEVVQFYQKADIFVFPSYREPGGNVIFEAMGYGLPLIASEIGGPGAAVDASCGIQLSASSPEQYAQDLASAISRLVDDQALRLALGAGARRRVAAVGLWDSKVDRFDEICADLSTRP
jgi:glycosyltransferase involved in cell wall biosynthesis